MRHFTDIGDLDGPALRTILQESAQRKAARADRPRGSVDDDAPLAGRILALLFELPSTRTRVSFNVGMRQLGGEVINLMGDEIQLGSREPVCDIARVLSRYVDAIMLRAVHHETLEEMVAHATVPVINGLTAASHPCQFMADVMTFEEHCGPIEGRRIAWSGDGNNMANTWIQGAPALGYELNLACPEALQPDAGVVARARERGGRINLTGDPREAVAGADCVMTDTWVSMSDDPASNRHNLLHPYHVDEALMAEAADHAVFMHCLPAHRGEEMTEGVIEGPQSVIFDQAENRLHAQKGVLLWCLGESG